MLKACELEHFNVPKPAIYKACERGKKKPLKIIEYEFFLN